MPSAAEFSCKRVQFSCKRVQSRTCSGYAERSRKCQEKVHLYEQLLNALHIPKPYNEDTYGVRIVDAKYIAYLCKNNYEAYRKLISADMQGIDDLGTEPSEVLDYDNVYTPVIDLLTKRYEEQLFTVITTNLTPQQIREHYGDRIADRLNEMVKKIVFNNCTYRIDKFATRG